MTNNTDPTLGYQEFHNIRQPYSDGRCVVYGDGEMGWYDYVLIDSAGRIEARSNMQYGSAEIALRDALIAASDGGAAMAAALAQQPAPPSAPAGVDWPIIVEGLRLADHFFDGDDHYWQPASKVRAAYRAALAAQQQGGA